MNMGGCPSGQRGKMVSATGKELAELFGNATGDGSFVKMSSGKIRFQLRGHIEEDRDHYDNFIIPTFNKIISQPITKRNVGILKYRQRHSYGIGTENKHIAEFLQSLELPLGTKGELSIPTWITDKKENTKAFLRGLMDTDGSVYFNKNNKSTKYNVPIIEIGSTSKKLIRKVYAIIRDLGFHPYLIKPYVKKKPNEKTLHKVRIKRKNDIKKWRKEIGFRNIKHESKFEVFEIYGFCPPKMSVIERKLVISGKLILHCC